MSGVIVAAVRESIAALPTEWNWRGLVQPMAAFRAHMHNAESEEDDAAFMRWAQRHKSLARFIEHNGYSQVAYRNGTRGAWEEESA